MTKLKLLTFVVVGLMTGCSSNALKATDPSVATVKEVSPATDLLNGAEKKDSAALRGKNHKANATAIDPKTMYLLLTAELAGQRNQYDVALEGYMQAATRVNDARVTERAAKIATFLEDPKKSNAAVDLWLKQDANNLDAHSLAALNALKSGRKSESVSHLEVLLDRDPVGFDETLLELLKAMGQSAKVSFVSSVLDELALKHPNQAVIYYVQSFLAMQVKDNQLAAAKLQRTLELRPDWNKALMSQAQLAMLNKDIEGAEKLLREDIKRFPAELKFKKMLAQILIKASKFDVAMTEYKAILKDHPDDGESQFSLALLHLQLQQDEDAKKYLEKLVGQPESAPQAGFYLGKLALKNSQWDKALAWFDSVNAGPFQFDASLAAVSIQIEKKRTEDAHRRLEKLKQAFPGQMDRILAVQAEVYRDEKQYAKAYKLLSEALQKKPGQRVLLYARALLAENMNNLPAMEADLQAILRDYPDDVATLNALGYTLASKTKRLKEAEMYLSKALKLQPDMAVIVDSYGWMLYKRGDYKQAKEFLERAYVKQPQAEIAGHLVETLLKLSMKIEAEGVLRKALDAEPNDEYLLKLKRSYFAK